MLKPISLLLLVTLFVSVISSCGNKKNTTETVAKEKTSTAVKTDDIKMKNMGYVKATVKDFTKSEGCGFLIVLQGSEQILQTLKPLESAFLKDGLEVWLKYRPIRPIAPTCKKGTPIDIEDIKAI